LVLLYHRVADAGAAPHEVVRSLPTSVFRQHLEVLGRIGHIVPLHQLLDPPRPGDGPRFAITFDDDHVGYVGTVLPVLHASRAPATFFLSGRVLHGLAPYWWTFVEQSIRYAGLEHTRRALRLDGTTPGELATALEGSPIVPRVADLLPASKEPQMTSADIRTLAEAGMTIGFHTVHHPILSRLAGQPLHAAMTAGWSELSDAAGARVDLLAYPHGRANSTVAAAARAAGFSAAFTAGGRPITYRSDRFLLSRWEPGPLGPEEFSAAVALRLLRSPTSPQAARIV
jgi:peptidoglycan/xylan/chitin deacetylase (PgdA/CDA1 family)